jgi:hypothetical protein
MGGVEFDLGVGQPHGGHSASSMRLPRHRLITVLVSVVGRCSLRWRSGLLTKQIGNPSLSGVESGFPAITEPPART